jgi:hypothetical protein
VGRVAALAAVREAFKAQEVDSLEAGRAVVAPADSLKRKKKPRLCRRLK